MEHWVDVEEALGSSGDVVEVHPTVTITGWVSGKGGAKYVLDPGRGYFVDRDLAREWSVLGYVQVATADIGGTPSPEEAEAIRARSFVAQP